MMRLVSAEPCFTVRDVGRAMEHYRRLGFTTSVHDESYAFAHRDGLTIHLMQNDETGDRAAASTLYVHVSDSDELAAEWTAAGIAVEVPVDYDYGLHEGRHIDPDGNVIRFGSPTRGSTDNR